MTAVVRFHHGLLCTHLAPRRRFRRRRSLCRRLRGAGGPEDPGGRLRQDLGRPTCEGSTSKKSGSRSPSTNEDQESQPTEHQRPAPLRARDEAADAGASTPPTLGFYCGKLEACCKALEKKGITGSANQCKSVVSTKNEFACDTTFQTYRAARTTITTRRPSASDGVIRERRAAVRHARR